MFSFIKKKIGLEPWFLIKGKEGGPKAYVDSKLPQGSVGTAWLKSTNYL